LNTLIKVYSSLKILSFKELKKVKEDNPTLIIPFNTEDIYYIIYISRLTKPLKGVIIKCKLLSD
jgi:hypothetical protein